MKTKQKKSLDFETRKKYKSKLMQNFSDHSIRVNGMNCLCDKLLPKNISPAEILVYDIWEKNNKKYLAIVGYKSK